MHDPVIMGQVATKSNMPVWREAKHNDFPVSRRWDAPKGGQIMLLRNLSQNALKKIVCSASLIVLVRGLLGKK